MAWMRAGYLKMCFGSRGSEEEREAEMASGRRATDEARDRESRQTTKSILKAKGLAQKLAIAQQLLQTGEEYGKRVKAVREYTTEWKTATEAGRAKLDWNEQWEKLRQLEQQHEQALSAAVRGLSLDDNLGAMHVLLESNQAFQARAQLANDMRLDAEGLAGGLRSLMRQRERAISSPAVGGAGVKNVEEALAKFAHALVSTHQLYEEVAAELDVQLAECLAQVQEAKLALRAASAVANNPNLLQELQAIREQVMQKYSFADDGAAAVVALEVDMWQMEMHEKLQALDERRIQQIDELQQLHAQEQQLEDHHGEHFDDAERERFVEMYKICSSTKQKTRGALLEELTKRLPDMPASRVKVYEAWYRSHRALANRKQDIHNSFKTMRATVLEEARTALQQSIKATLESLEQQRKQAMHEQHRKLLHERLAAIRAELASQEEHRHQEEEERRRLEQHAAEMHEKAVQRQREAKKQLVAKYREAKQKLEEKQREMEEQAAAEEAQLRKQRMLTNQARLQYRQQRLEAKEANRLRALELLEQEAAQRMAVLEKLAQQVPYYDRIQEAKADLSKTTAAVEAATYQPPEEQLRGHLPLNGFADARVMQDPRFRLALALREAGVIQSNYAKSIIEALHPRPQAPI